jgi:hypothetical protein
MIRKAFRCGHLKIAEYTIYYVSLGIWQTRMMTTDMIDNLWVFSAITLCVLATQYYLIGKVFDLLHRIYVIKRWRQIHNP